MAPRCNDAVADQHHRSMDAASGKSEVDMNAIPIRARAAGRLLIGSVLSLWLLHSTSQAAMTTRETVIEPGPFARGDPTGPRTVLIVRDAELESILRDYIAPLARAASLDADSLRIRLVKNPAFNAFVTGGLNMFVNTGMLMRSQHSGQVIGVMAHEIGHVARGHVARARQAVHQAERIAVHTRVLGLPAVLAGGPAAGVVVAGVGVAAAQGSYFSYRRIQEAAADQFAITVLERTGQSAQGLLETMEMLGQEESLWGGRQASYLRTHPPSLDRVDIVRRHMAESEYSDTPTVPEFHDKFRRMRAKLQGFLAPPEQTFARYPHSDTSLEARYARAAAHSRRANLSRALEEIDSLISERPDDPFFHELKGQILFENGRVAEAIEPYQRAVSLRPDAPLLRLSLAEAQVETNEPTQNSRAIEHLRAALHANPRDPRAWYRLSVALGREGGYGLSALASAERAHLLGSPEEARFHAARALRRLPAGSPGAVRAEDIQLGE